jgi:hypothetical protein
MVGSVCPLHCLNSPAYPIGQAGLERGHGLGDRQVAQLVALTGGGATPYAHGPGPPMG